MTDFAMSRNRMVDRQVAARGISGARLLASMRKIPREFFVPETLRESVYDDSPLPIEAEQTISQPYVVALMIESAGVRDGQRVLEIGAGSGYAAAILAEMGTELYAVERHRELAELASGRLRHLGYPGARVRHGDGSLGWPEHAPFEVILVSASGSHVPDTLLKQLTIGGRLVMPIGEANAVQSLMRVTREGDDDFQQQELGPVRFVPLIGVYGWRDEPGADRPEGTGF